MEEVNYCLCGCGEIATAKGKRFVIGHSKNLKNQIPPKCKCGCGGDTNFDKWINRWNDYIAGHSLKNKSQEHINKIAESGKKRVGDLNSFFGRKHTEESKEKMSKKKTGVPNPKNQGENHPFYGRKLSDEDKERLRAACLGRKHTDEEREKIRKANTGKKHSKETKKKLSESAKKRTGDKNSNWRGGINKLTNAIRNCEKYNYWKVGVFIRDDHSCQKCGSKKETEAHHIVHFNTIMINHNIQTLEEALNTQELWNVDNGITLCKKCHKLEHKTKDQHDTTP